MRLVIKALVLVFLMTYMIGKPKVFGGKLRQKIITCTDYSVKFNKCFKWEK